MCCVVVKSGSVKEQEGKGLLSSLGIKTPLSEVRLYFVLGTKWMK